VHRLNIRRVPFLEFKLDTSIAEGAAVLAHLDEVRREDAGSA
jgi:ribosome-binding factor A